MNIIKKVIYNILLIEFKKNMVLNINWEIIQLWQDDRLIYQIKINISLKFKILSN